MASALGLALALAALGCPFCTALEPTLSSRRDAAAVLALGEVVSRQPPGGNAKAEVRLHRVLQGETLLAGRQTISVPAGALKPGSLVLVFGDEAAGVKNDAAEPAPAADLRFTAVAASEIGWAYFAQAPPGRTAAADRLRYFARFLEHADPLIAADAYQEFAHASYADVVKAASALPIGKMSAWVQSERVAPARKGFYALALALEPDKRLRAEYAGLLWKLISAPQDDFRAGFDGILASYLLIGGESALGQIDELYLDNPRAADGDLRHALAALRFYREFGQDIPRERLAGALRHALARPEFAADVVTDLARWQDWSALSQVAGLYAKPAYGEAAVRRAIVGYLLACPEPAAAAELKRLRESDPAGVAAAEAILSRLGAAKQ